MSPTSRAACVARLPGISIALVALATAAVAAPPPRATGVRAACARHAACGCPVVDCVASYGASELPGGVFGCMAEVECAALCAPDAGQPGTVVATTCFSEAAIMAALAAEQEEVVPGDLVPVAEPSAPPPPTPETPATVEVAPATKPGEAGAGTVAALIRRACSRGTACGCPTTTEAECEAAYARDGASGGPALFTCLAALDCAATCEPNAGTPGTQAYARCVAPAIARIKSAAEAGAAEAAARRGTTMSIINNYPTGGAKRRVYDQSGRLIREE